MKKLIILLLVTFVVVACTSAQIRSDYQINYQQQPEAAKYLIFIEEREVPIGFALQDSVDYLDPINLLNYKIAETTSALPVIISLKNDGKYVKAGVVVEDTAGFYSVMGVSEVFRKGIIPNKPNEISIEKR